MLVKDVMSKDLAYATPGQTVMEAARLMKTQDVGAIPIVENQQTMKLVGIITDRDIAVRVVADGKNPNEVKLEAMPRNLATVNPEDDIERVTQIMQQRQVRRIPVVDEKGRLVGIVAQADVAQEHPDADVVKETVEKVSKPGTEKKKGAA